MVSQAVAGATEVEGPPPTSGGRGWTVQFQVAMESWSRECASTFYLLPPTSYFLPPATGVLGSNVFLQVQVGDAARRP